MNTRFMSGLTATASACALLLAACGGGGGGGDNTPTDPTVSGTDVPRSATQSAMGAFAFVSSVGATTSETAPPIALGDATLATSETEEPRPL